MVVVVVAVVVVAVVEVVVVVVVVVVAVVVVVVVVAVVVLLLLALGLVGFVRGALVVLRGPVGVAGVVGCHPIILYYIISRARTKVVLVKVVS